MSDIRLLEDEFLAQKYNDMVSKVYDDMRDFVALHYTGGKSDTEFWMHCETMDKPDRVSAILYLAQSRLTRSFDFDNVVGTVRQESWNPILAGLGHFPQSVINSVMSSDGASQAFWMDQIEKFRQETGEMIQDNLSADELNKLLLSLG
jgi:tryptophan halogenase